jgi:hypothetical protein
MAAPGDVSYLAVVPGLNSGREFWPIRTPISPPRRTKRRPTSLPWVDTRELETEVLTGAREGSRYPRGAPHSWMPLGGSRPLAPVFWLLIQGKRAVRVARPNQSAGHAEP